MVHSTEQTDRTVDMTILEPEGMVGEILGVSLYLVRISIGHQSEQVIHQRNLQGMTDIRCWPFVVRRGRHYRREEVER